MIHAVTPGLRLFHHGQLEGRRGKLPIQLGREPEETPDPEWTAFYHRLLHLTREPLFKDVDTHVLPVIPPRPGEDVHQSLIGFAYRLGDQVGLVAVNYGYAEASGFFRFPEGFWQGWERVVFAEIPDVMVFNLRASYQAEIDLIVNQLVRDGRHKVAVVRIHAVSSARRGLTAVFGMGTGVALSVESPENFSDWVIKREESWRSEEFRAG